MNRALNMRPAHFALRLHPCTPRTRGVRPPPRTHDRWRRFYCDFRIVSSRPFGTEKRRTYAEQEVCGRPTRLARSFIFSGRSSERMDAMGPRPPRRAVSTVFRPAPSLRQGALHNASFRRGIGRVSGMCRSLSLCCTASRRLPAPPGRSPPLSPSTRIYTWKRAVTIRMGATYTGLK